MKRELCQTKYWHDKTADEIGDSNNWVECCNDNHDDGDDDDDNWVQRDEATLSNNCE